MASFDIEQFIQFGNILCKEQRQRLVEYITKKVSKIKIHQFFFEDLSPYKEQIDQVFSNQESLSVAADHPNIAKQITACILQSFEETRKEYFVKNPYTSEKEELTSWQNKTPQEVIDSSDKLFKTLKSYIPEETDINFYEKTLINEKDSLKKDKLRLEALVDTALEKWQINLTERELKYELDLIETKRAHFCKELYDQIDKFRRMKEVLTPFTDDLGRLWDLSAGVWRKTDLRVLSQYAQFLEHEQSIRELAELLGRMKSEERDLEEQERSIKVFKNEWQTAHASKAELVGVCESDDISNLLPSEIVLLANSSLETIFLKKFAEKKLMTFEYEAKILAKKEETIVKKELSPKKDKKGPVIICVDTSASMHGEPENVAKAVAFAILRVALRDKRPCYLISFSTAIKTLELNELQNSVEQIIDFLSMSFNGGTDAEPALEEALRQIEDKKYADSDILVISDFIMDSLSADLVKRIENAKNAKNRFFSLVISPNANQAALKSFNNNWNYELNGSGRVQQLVLAAREVTS